MKISRLRGLEEVKKVAAFTLINNPFLSTSHLSLATYPKLNLK